MAISIRGDGPRRVPLRHPERFRPPSPLRVRRVDPATIPPGTRVPLSHPDELAPLDDPE